MRTFDLMVPLAAIFAAFHGVAAMAMERPTTEFPSSRADTAELLRAKNLGLISRHACLRASNSCTLVAAKQANGEAVVFRLFQRSCISGDENCLGGFAVEPFLAGKPGRDTTGSTSSAKLSGKPGEDGAPPDPQDQAQADATNEIIEALADGQYENDIDQFWTDLESIQTWDNPQWREPDSHSTPSIEDTILVSGSGRGREPAVLVSGRYKGDNGTKACGWWVGKTSPTTTIDGLRNWISNAAFDGCKSEVAVFSENSAALLVKPERRWSKDSDTLSYQVSAPIKIPTTVWIVHADEPFDDEVGDVERALDHANDVFARSRCGITIEANVINKTSALADPAQDLGCASIDTILKSEVGFRRNRMNVYIVNSLIADTRSGVACTAESDNVIMLDQGRADEDLAHEFGHWLDLVHTDGPALDQVNPRNIMAVQTPKADRDMVTAGQCYRANFSKNSYINRSGLRDGSTRDCRNLLDADGECPGLKNEF